MTKQPPARTLSALTSSSAALWHHDRLARLVAVAQPAGAAPRAAEAVAAADELARRNPRGFWRCRSRRLAPCWS